LLSVKESENRCERKRFAPFRVVPNQLLTGILRRETEQTFFIHAQFRGQGSEAREEIAPQG
jgi:hypothetical protein